MKLAKLLALVLLPSIAHGTSVLVPVSDIATSYVSPGPTGLSVIAESSSKNYDLSDLTGLTPGQPIEVSMTLDAAILWTGGFSVPNPDPFILNLMGTMAVSAGAFGDFLDQSETVPASGPFESVVGYSDLVGPDSLAFVVPWGTDLSAVQVSLLDKSAVVGGGGYFLESFLQTPSFTLSTSSIPEPSGTLLLSAGLVLMLSRRSRGR